MKRHVDFHFMYIATDTRFYSEFNRFFYELLMANEKLNVEKNIEVMEWVNFTPNPPFYYERRTMLQKGLFFYT